MSSIGEKFRANLRHACTVKGLTQQELARRSGVHWVTISRILHGHQEPSMIVCERLAEAARIPRSKIFS